MKESAKKYRESGLQVIPIGKDKIPTIKKWQESKQEYNFEGSYGIGLVCREGIHGLDFDLKYDLTGKLFDEYKQLVGDTAPGLLEKMVVQKTVNGGYHFIYRCFDYHGNKKLANRPTTENEKSENPKDKVRVLIETRGTKDNGQAGGYLAVYPTPGYTLVYGDLTKLSEITSEEQEILFSCARSFNQVIEKPYEKKEAKQQYKDNISPFEDWNERSDVLAFLEQNGWKVARQHGTKHLMLRPGGTGKWSADYDTQKRLFFVWTSSTDFEEDKAYNPSQVLTIIQFNGDYSAAAKWLLKQGYGKFNSKQPKISLAADIKPIQIKDEKEIQFWSHTVNPQTKKIKIFPIYYNLKQWLHKRGYWRYVYSKDKWMLVNIKDNVITEIYKKDVKKEVLDYILGFDFSESELSADMVFETFAEHESKIFSDGIFEIIDEVSVTWNKDTEDNAYYYFKNKCVLVTKDDYTLIDYSQLNGAVWASQIIQRDITIEKDYDNDFFQFMCNVCGGKQATNGNELVKAQDKLDSFNTTFGYLLHGYKSPAFLPAVILTDEIISDDPNGGSGKGIIIKAISHFKNVVEIDGKNFDFDKSFAFQRVNLDTQVIAFQDVSSKFDFEKLFSIITEGINVEKKNKDEFSIPFCDSPKIMVTTNYVIKGNGGSHERRKVELELTGHYHKGYSPKDEFGRLLFDSWNDAEWNKFYNYMFDCVKAYLTNGVVEILSENMKFKKINSQTCKEFVEWAETGILPNTEYNKKDLFNSFLESNPDFKNVKQRSFSIWLEKWSVFKSMPFKLRKSMENRFIIFGDAPIPTKQESEQATMNF